MGAKKPLTQTAGSGAAGWWDVVVASAGNVKLCIRDNGFFTDPLPMDGFVDEVRFFDRPLTSAEVSDLYNAGHFGKCR